MDIYAKIKANHYQPHAEYPTKPVEPAILHKAGRDLTDTEAASLPTARRDYQEAMKFYREAQGGYRKAEAEAQERFQADLEEENGMNGHPKADLLFKIAWEKGHSDGYDEVVFCYDELVELAR